MISVYEYIDYRRFLKDRFFYLKKKHPLFSFRSFNRLAGIKSSGFLKLVIDGKRNLADEGIHKFARGFKLTEAETKYFEALVKFNQATTHEEKNHYFNELSQNKKFLSAKPLAAFQYHLLSDWYYVAIMELARVEIEGVKDLKWLQEHLNPSVGMVEIKNAVEGLKRLDLLSQEKNGNLVRKETMLTTEDEVKSVAAINFHAQMSQLSARAVGHAEAKDREFSSLTIVASEQGFQKAKQEIRKFRKKLHSILEQENDAPKIFVAHINLQLFKLSH